MPTCLAGTAITDERVNTVVCTDGYRLRYRTWRASERFTATIILVNGMMSHSGWFREWAGQLAACQLHVVGADRRGSGLNKHQRGDAPSRQILIDDLLRIIQQESHGKPVYLAGWCWGAVVTVHAALDFRNDVSGLVLLAPGLFPSKSIKDVARGQIIMHAHEHPHTPCLQSPITEDMFSDQQPVREFILRDQFAQRRFTRRFFDLSAEMSLIAAARLSQLKLPVLLLLAACDETIDREQTLKAFSRVSSVSMRTLPSHHGMHFEVPQQLAAHITQWLTTSGAPVRAA